MGCCLYPFCHHPSKCSWNSKVFLDSSIGFLLFQFFSTVESHGKKVTCVTSKQTLLLTDFIICFLCFCFRSLNLLEFWILFENVMSLHRTKATIIGLLEASRVNEWVVTEKLGDALKSKAGSKVASKKPRFKIGDRFHLLELGVGFYLFFCGCYDVMFGKNHYFIFLFIQAIAFFIMAFGYVGTFVPTS
ncbi:hypothetical protein S83_019597 [Arachis hypogaea]